MLLDWVLYGQSQFLSAHPCHKEETTLSHEDADIITDEGISIDSTKDCSSGTSASKIPTEDTHVKFGSVSDLNTKSEVDHDDMQSDKIPDIDPNEPSPSPVKLRRSTRSTKGIPPTRYGSVSSHMVNVPSKFGKLLNSISRKVDIIADHLFD